jgi:hypothetical protein
LNRDAPHVRDHFARALSATAAEAAVAACRQHCERWMVRADERDARGAQVIAHQLEVCIAGADLPGLRRVVPDRGLQRPLVAAVDDTRDVRELQRRPFDLGAEAFERRLADAAAGQELVRRVLPAVGTAGADTKIDDGREPAHFAGRRHKDIRGEPDVNARVAARAAWQRTVGVQFGLLGADLEAWRISASLEERNQVISCNGLTCSALVNNGCEVMAAIVVHGTAIAVH